MQSVAGTKPIQWLVEEALSSPPYGWRRWGASLLAIHDVDRMTALDLPWWNVAATHTVEKFLAKTANARVFEYGAGASSVWLAKRAKTVISVEHHVEWHRQILRILQPFENADLWQRNLDSAAYVDAIEEAGGPFDLIVIDGRRRIDCLRRAVAHLSANGVILFDDSGRRRYRHGIASSGLNESRYFGRSYCVPYPDCSSILHG